MSVQWYKTIASGRLAEFLPMNVSVARLHDDAPCQFWPKVRRARTRAAGPEGACDLLTDGEYMGDEVPFLTNYLFSLSDQAVS